MKKLISLVLAIFMLMSATVLSFADSDVLSGKPENKNFLQRIDFAYNSLSDTTTSCFYTNDYFWLTSYWYNQSLATATMGFALSAFGSTFDIPYDYSNQHSNAVEFLKKIGMKEENIVANDWYTVKPTNDSAAVIAGNMPITVDNKDYTLVAVAVRGSGYEREWASNFTIGAEGQHQGFSEGKEIVISFLRDYFKSQNISGNVKLWITGYSRGAAIANLVGGAIDDGLVIDDDINYTLDDVYTYCFSCPAGALTSELKSTWKYGNIYNIINPNDPVPFVAPADLGFCRYGTDIFLPTAESHPDEYEDMLNRMKFFYYGMDGTEEYIVDDFQMKKLGMANWLPGGEPIEFIVDDTKNDFSQNVFLSNYVSIISKEFLVTRDNYVVRYQDQIREICSVIFGCTYKQRQILIDSLIAQAQAGWGELLTKYIQNVGLGGGTEDEALMIISGWLKTAIKEAGITDYDEAIIDSAGIALGDLALALAINHPNYLSTAVMNASSLGSAHYPELCFAWMVSLDPNYDGTKEYTYNGQAYRVVYVEGESDVNAYRTEDNALVASIIGNEPVKIEGSEYKYGIDGNVKYFIFPCDKSYKLEIKNAADTTVKYTVKEYNSSVGFTRMVEFKDVSFTAEEYLIGDIPSYSLWEIISGAPEGSSVNYTLVNSSGKNENVDFEMSRGTTFEINASSANEEYGIAKGGNVYKYGEVAVLNAESNEGCKFLGWSENGEIISHESKLEFSVFENRNLTALFESKELTPIAGNGVWISDKVVYGMWDMLDLEKTKTLFEESSPLKTNAKEYVGTGSKLNYYEKTYTVLILGDVDGSGDINSTDCLRIKRYFLHLYELDDLYLNAADVNRDGEITATDYLRIKMHFLGKGSMYENKVA